MSRRHYYERRYYYRRFKGAMDGMYKLGGVSCLLLGIFAGIWFESFWLGLCFYVAAIIYHSQFIARQQRDLAQFWGEGDDQSVGRALKSGCVQYTVFIGVLLLFLNGALSRCSGPSARHRDTEPSKSTSASPALSLTPPPPATTYSQLEAAITEIHRRFAKRVENSIYTTHDAYVRSYDLDGDRPTVRTRVRDGKVGYVFHEICRTTLREYGIEAKIETEYGK
jgi:hypothetical protein